MARKRKKEAGSRRPCGARDDGEGGLDDLTLETDMNFCELQLHLSNGDVIFLPDSTQSLEVLALGALRRTVNGKLVCTGTGLQKYKSVIQGEGQIPVGFEKLERGQQVTVHCLQRLWQEVVAEEVLLSRPAVEGSVFAMTERKEVVPLEQIKRRKFRLEEGIPEGKILLSYRPLLEMRLTKISSEGEEWGDKRGWRLSLDEI
ncbi:MAG: hypothetical protein WCG05_04635 [Alphaproteobacteria bacterium]